MSKKLYLASWLPVILFFAGCQQTPPDLTAKDDVTIVDRGNYYEVTLDYTRGATPRQMGVAYGKKIQEVIPNFETIVDSYISEVTFVPPIYQILIARSQNLKAGIDPAYREEIEGLASTFSGADRNWFNDGRISTDEVYLLNLMGDVWRLTECAGAAVWGPRSATGKCITARLFDWSGGKMNQLTKIPAVTTIKNGDKSVCLIGYLGYLAAISGFNQQGVFGGVLDCQSGAGPYRSGGKRSYMLDLRYALEHYKTLDEVGAFLIDPANQYTVNHLIFLSDPNVSKVVENNFSGSGTNMRRALRTDTSPLNPGVTWDLPNAIGVVNSFVLEGNQDNHTMLGYNTERWATLKREIPAKGDTVSFEQLKQIATFHTDQFPGAQDAGDIYCGANQTIILFEPSTFHLEIAFKPRDGSPLPAQPVFNPVTVNLSQN
jgi:hypothetical protein